MTDTTFAPFKRIILRAILNDVSPIVARVIAVSDDLEISDLQEVFLSIFGWAYDPGFIIRISPRNSTASLSLLDPRLFDALGLGNLLFLFVSGAEFTWVDSNLRAVKCLIYVGMEGISTAPPR